MPENGKIDGKYMFSQILKLKDFNFEVYEAIFLPGCETMKHIKFFSSSNEHKL